MMKLTISRKKNSATDGRLYAGDVAPVAVLLRETLASIC
jgi:hypothetical protein